MAHSSGRNGTQFTTRVTTTTATTTTITIEEAVAAAATTNDHWISSCGKWQWLECNDNDDDVCGGGDAHEDANADVELANPQGEGLPYGFHLTDNLITWKLSYGEHALSFNYELSEDEE